MDISNNQIKSYKEEGAILLKGVFIDWVETLETGIEKLIKNPSPRERSYLPEDGTATVSYTHLTLPTNLCV